jgi:hypothetical protein
MSYKQADFKSEIAINAKIYKWSAAWRTDLTTMATALGTDTTTHDTTIQAAPVALRPGVRTNNKYKNDIALIINKGKGGNLTAAQMAAAMNAVAAGP